MFVFSFFICTQQFHFGLLILEVVFFFNLILFFKLYIVVLVLPNIKMNPPQVYMCFFAPVISREITYFLPASFN